MCVAEGEEGKRAKILGSQVLTARTLQKKEYRVGLPAWF